MEDATTFEDAWEAKYGQVSASDPAEEAAAPAAAEPEAGVEAESSVAVTEGEPAEETAQAGGTPSEPPQAGEEVVPRSQYEGTKVRYIAEERKRRELEQRLAEMEQRLAQPPKDDASKPPALELDESEQAELDAFRKAHPNLAKATVDNPRTAAHWQKLLLERGEDEVAAIYDASVSAAAGPVETVRAELERRDAEQRRTAAEAHLAAIEGQHPDWSSLLVNPAPQHEQDRYHPEFVSWVDMLPFKVAQGVAWAVQQGAADDVNKVIAAYKAYRANRSGAASTRGTQQPSSQPLSAQARAAAQAATVVPTRGTASPRSRPGGDATFEELWVAKYGT